MHDIYMVLYELLTNISDNIIFNIIIMLILITAHLINIIHFHTAHYEAVIPKFTWKKVLNLNLKKNMSGGPFIQHHTFTFCPAVFERKHTSLNSCW